MTWEELYFWSNEQCCILNESGIPELGELSPSWVEMAETFSRLEEQYGKSAEAAALAIAYGQPIPTLEPAAKFLLYERFCWANEILGALSAGHRWSVLPEPNLGLAHAADWLLVAAWNQGGFGAIHERLEKLISYGPPAKAPFGDN